MYRAFKYRLYPTRQQLRLLERTLETCRRLYNLCLAERKAAWETEKRSIAKYEQMADIKSYRKANPYAAEVHSHILQVTVADLDKAFQAFFRRVKLGQKAGYPRFRGRGRFTSFGLKELGNGFRLDGRRLKVTGIGRIAVRWHRPIPGFGENPGEGNIKTLRLSRQADGWYACLACEIPEPPGFTVADSRESAENPGVVVVSESPAPGFDVADSRESAENPGEIGIDVGIKSLLTLSDGSHVENPKWYRASQIRLRVLQRRVARRKKGGANRRKAVAALARYHQHIANRRADYLNKLAADLVGRFDCIAIEDLQIQNMVRNHSLSKSILDAGWGFFRNRLSNKAECAGRVVVAVPPANTSRACSSCGAIFEGLTLADRWVTCACGLSLDRDHNAALNIVRLGHNLWDKTWAKGPCVSQEAVGL